MKLLRGVLWLLPIVLAVVFWWFPPRGDDAYYHSVGAVEQVRAWQEGAVFPGYHRGWNGGTGSFAPTVYAPIPMAIQGGFGLAGRRRAARRRAVPVPGCAGRSRIPHVGDR